jgi:hypothetical protein
VELRSRGCGRAHGHRRWIGLSVCHGGALYMRAP